MCRHPLERRTREGDAILKQCSSASLTSYELTSIMQYSVQPEMDSGWSDARAMPGSRKSQSPEEVT